MKIGKVLAVSAVSGILMGVVGCGGDKAAAAPAADPATSSGEKTSCSGKSGCHAGAAGSAAPAASGSAAPAGEKQACSGKQGCSASAPKK